MIENESRVELWGYPCDLVCHLGGEESGQHYGPDSLRRYLGKHLLFGFNQEY
jgi:hypothetical protein